jgi:DNA (cytosine-5)-methyltransferase 1
MINYLSLFTGIGAFEKAMKNQGIPFNLVGFSEIDENAVKSYCAMHGVSENLNLGDITKIDETALPKIDFITYGFPCQDISIAGKWKGLFNDDGTQTRSGLFFDALRIIEHTKPLVAVAENVKNLLSSKFNAQFQVILASLEYAGYNNYFAVLNAKDYGIPQNRERVFIVSIRKDVDNGTFEFPKPITLVKKLSDVLESGFVDRDISLCIASRYVGFCGSQSYLRRRYFGKSFGQAVFEGNTTAEEQRNFFKTDPYKEYECDGRIRQMTTLECFRLFGFSDADHMNAKNVNVSARLYEQIGNSIVVNVAEAIIKQIFRKGGEFDAVYR